MSYAYTRFLYFDFNVVKTYDTDPGVDPRVSELDLNTSGITYNFPTHRALYNAADDRVYVNCTIDTGGGPVQSCIVFNPRTMAVENSFTPPIRDVQGDTIWAFSASDLIALDTTSLTEIFRTPYNSSVLEFQFGISDRRAMMYDYASNPGFTIATVITITSPTTFSSATNLLAMSAAEWPNNFTPWFTRPYWYEGQKAWIRSSDATPGGLLGAIIDITTNAISYVNNPTGESYSGDNGPYIDSCSGRIWLSQSDQVTFPNLGSVGLAVDLATGTLEGPYGGAIAPPAADHETATDWYEGYRLTACGSFLMKNFANTDLGRFVAGSVSTRVASEILTSSTTTTPVCGDMPYWGSHPDSIGVASIPPDASPEPPVELPKIEASVGGGGGNCGVQFEHLEMFQLLKSLMGGGYTLREALKFLDQEDIEFIEEEDLMDDLPLEIPHRARQGGSPKMIDRRIDLAPINKLNKMISEYEVKLQECNRQNMKRRGQ